MKKLHLFFIATIILSSIGCAADDLHQNQLQNLTERQSQWYDRTNEGWRFE